MIMMMVYDFIVTTFTRSTMHHLRKLYLETDVDPLALEKACKCIRAKGVKLA